MSLDGKDRRKGKRRRVDCPRCGRDVPISHINSKMWEHPPPGKKSKTNRCIGSGYSPTDVREHLRQEAALRANAPRLPEVMPRATPNAGPPWHPGPPHTGETQMNDDDIDQMVRDLMHGLETTVGETYDAADNDTRIKLRRIVREHLFPVPQQTVIMGNAVFGSTSITCPPAGAEERDS